MQQLLAIEVTIETMLVCNVVSLIAIEVTIETMLVCNVVSLSLLKGKAHQEHPQQDFPSHALFYYIKFPSGNVLLQLFPKHKH